MKTFVVLLLLANIAYFGWNQGWLRDIPPPRAATPRAVDNLPAFVPGPARLTLLAELPPGTAPDPTTNPDPGVRTNLGVTEPATNPDPGAGADPRVRPAMPTDQPWCANLGLFTLEEEAVTLLSHLTDLDVEAQVQSGLVPVASTFWVHLPAFASEAEAFRTLQELQERNIDSYFMRTGEMAGGISLGVFSRPESAEVARANFERRGYNPSIREVMREEDRYWVALSAPSAALLETPQWLDFRTNFASLPLAENVCTDVALPTGFP